MKYTDTLDEALARYSDYCTKRVVRAVWEALHPVGMHTNGPCRVTVNADLLLKLLSRWESATDQPKETPK